MKSINLIKLILKEELSKILNEDITSGSAIVYHRTGKGGSPIEGIASDGFRAGSGASYGVGVYTTYTLESQLNDNMKSYGNIIIECKVNSLYKFLIFDYDIAKKVYGNRNYTLDRQLRLILGNEWKDYKDNEKLKTLIEKLPVVKYTSEIAKPFYNEFKDTIINKLRGMIFTGSNDGNVLVSYDRKNIEPIRYSEDEGKTWKNILDKNIYKRIKGHNPKEDITYDRVLNNLKIGELSKYDVEYIENNFKLFYNEFKLLYSQSVYDLLKYSKNPIQIAKIIGIDRVHQLLYELNSYDINNLIKSSRNPINMAKLIGMDKINQSLSYLSSYDIKYLLEDSPNPDEIAKMYINAKGDKLDSSDISNLIYRSQNPDEIAKFIINAKGDNLNLGDIYNLIYRSQNPDEIAKFIINVKGDKLDSDDIYYLLIYSQTPIQIAQLIGMDRVNKYLYSSDGIYNLVNGNPKNPNEIKKLLIQAGVDKSLIP